MKIDFSCWDIAEICWVCVKQQSLTHSYESQGQLWYENPCEEIMFVGQEACTFLYFVFKSCLMWIMWSLVNVINIFFSVHSNLGNERINFVECQVSNCSAIWWRKQVTFEWKLSFDLYSTCSLSQQSACIYIAPHWCIICGF